MPPSYWDEACAAATHLVNLRPSQPIGFAIPYTCLHNTAPDYAALRVFSCLCYPNQSATAKHNLSPRSVACVFLGYPRSDTKRTIRFCVTPHKGASLYCIYIGSDVQGLDSKQRSKQDLNNNYRNHLEGYMCLDLQTRHVIISRHVIFDESVFPFSHSPNKPDTSVVAFDFLLELAATTFSCAMMQSRTGKIRMYIHTANLRSQVRLLRKKSES
jgi:hypothetical protein